MFVILLGPPGVGKGTQARKICATYHVSHVSTGDILRQAIADSSELGRRVANYLEQGQLVPDDLIVDVVVTRLQQADCQRGCLLDGFPRTLPQAEALQQQLTATENSIAAVIHLVADATEIKERLLRRADTEGRPDDTDETIGERLRVYQEQTEPLVSYYREQELLHQIDGMGTPDEVFSRIQAVLPPAATNE